jgi:EmrB/QacA subfamily drug resistance transporter
VGIGIDDWHSPILGRGAALRKRGSALRWLHVTMGALVHPRSYVQRFEYKHVVAAVFIFGLFMYSLDTTIVNVALPRLGEEFQASTDQLEWVITGYLVSLAVWVPACGWIGDRFGTKRTFLLASIIFVVSSALCGSAWSIESLAFFRVVQGIGGGMMTPVGTAMVYRVYTVQERASASAIIGIPTQVAPMLGPVLGGLLVDRVSWRWIFYVNLPVGAISVLFAFFGLREHREQAGKFDPAGFVLSGLGLAGVLFALSHGAVDGWTSSIVLGTGLGGIVCFLMLVYVELHSSAPMLDFSLFQSRMFRRANAVGVAMFGAQNGILFLLPLYLQGLRGLPALESGLVTFLQPVGTMCMVQVTSRIYMRLGPRRNLAMSTCGVVVTAGLLAVVGLDTNLWLIRGIMLLRGCFMAFNMVSMQTTAFATVPREKMGRASSMFSALRQVGAAFGVATVGTVLITSTNASSAKAVASAASEASRQAGLLAFHYAFAGAAVLGLIALFFALRIHDEDAAALRMPVRPEAAAIEVAAVPVKA